MMTRRIFPLEEFQGMIDGEWVDTYEIAAETALIYAQQDEYEKWMAEAQEEEVEGEDADKGMG